MRIAYIADTRAIGGAERYLAILAERAAVAGHEVLTLTPQAELVDWLRREAPSAHTQHAFNDDYHDAHTASDRGAALLKLMHQMMRSLRGFDPDVLHVNNGGFPGSDLCRIAPAAARLAGIPSRIMTVHSIPWSRSHDGRPFVQAAADRLVWSCADWLVCPSEAVAERLRLARGMPRHLGRTIYYGVARAERDPRSVSALRARLAPAGELLVGMVSARPVPEKGYGVFLDALAAARRPVRGVVVGPPPGDLAARARALGIERRLVIEGPRECLGDYYSAFDVLTVPSTAEECMPLVIIEAASVGTPSFGSRLSGVPEAIADGVNGRLFAPGAADELALLIDSAEQDRMKIISMGHAAHERWHAQFQVEAMVDSTLALYADDRPRTNVSGTRNTASK